jgi:FMN phosphatase YigB (HAD superfamily)
VAKPSPAFFQKAAEAAGVAPERTLMVGDSYRADVRGAWAAGMDAVWLDRTEGISITPDDEPVPTDVRVIRSLHEVPEIVRIGGPLPRGDVADLVPASSG